MQIYNKQDLVKELEILGLPEGGLINLKISLGSIGYIIDGAKTLIDALLEVVGPRGTISQPAFVNSYFLPMTEAQSHEVSGRYSPSYAGAVANAMVWHPDAYCSTHPIQRFAAIGYRARELMEAHKPESFAYDVLRVMAQEGGKTLKIGTDKKAVGIGTTHVAVELVGLKRNNDVQKGLNYFDYRDKQIKLFKRHWPTVCQPVFEKFTSVWVDAIEARGKIGLADATIADMGRALDAEVALLKSQPEAILCGRYYCPCCAGWSHTSYSNEAKLLYYICVMGVIGKQLLKKYID